MWSLGISHDHLRGPHGPWPLRGSSGSFRGPLGAKIFDRLGFDLYWWFYGRNINGDINRRRTTTDGDGRQQDEYREICLW